jgi:hypothetical protein
MGAPPIALFAMGGAPIREVGGGRQRLALPWLESPIAGRAGGLGRCQVVGHVRSQGVTRRNPGMIEPGDLG